MTRFGVCWIEVGFGENTWDAKTRIGGESDRYLGRFEMTSG